MMSRGSHLLVAVLWTFSSLSHAQSGADWIQSQAQPDGSLATGADLATPFQATAEATAAFVALGEAGRPVVPAARQYLQAETHAGTEYLARRIAANRAAGVPVQDLVTELLSRQGVDGGFGAFAGYHSNPLDTAFALDALIADQVYATPLSRAVGYLANAQAADGSWGRSTDLGGVDVTATVIRALNPYRKIFGSVPQAMANGVNYLLSQRNAAGLWDQDFLTAAAVLAVAQTATDVTSIRSSAEALRGRQLANGSWDGDVYTTALALRAVNAFDARSGGGSAGSTTGTAVGYVFAGGTGEPLANASVAAPSGATTTTNAAGYFVLNGLAAGDQTLEARKTGYVSSSRVVTVRAGQSSSSGEIYLAPTGQVGFVQGTIFDASSGETLTAATVTVGTASGNSAGDGAFDIGAINPGGYAFSVSKTGYHAVNGTLTVSAGATTIVRQGLVREGTFLNDSAADIRGVVSDANTGARLSGVAVQAENGRASTTDTTGAFVLADMPRGAHEVTLTRNGYEGRTYSFNFAPGAQGNLGTLVLYAETDASTPSTLNIYGTVVDSVSSQGLAGATITVQQTGESTTSDAQGRFVAGGIPQLTVDLVISAGGHASRTFQINASGYGDVASTFALPPSGGDDTATSSTIRGVVSDTATGAPIAGAAIDVAGSTRSATADAGGAFEISGITDLSFTLNMAAVGYIGRSYDINLSKHGVYNSQFQLEPAPEPDRFQIVAFVADTTGAGADVVQTFQARIANVTTEPQSTLVIGEVIDGMGNSVGTITPYAPGTTQPQSEFSFAPEQELELTVPWDPAQAAPGNYRVILRLVEPGTINRELPLGVVLNESETTASVAGSHSIKGELGFSPPLVQAGTNQSVALDALVVNGGNLPLMGAAFTLVVRDPANGQTLFSAQATTDVLDVGQNTTLSFGSWVPTRSGNLPVVVSVSDGTVPGQVTGTLYVGDKATGSFTVDRAVVPLGTQTVRGNVALEGVDVTTGTSTDPLFFAVKEAIRKGGEYVGPNAISWHNSNQCLGCHVQTQSFLGMAAARDKATIKESDVQFLHNTLAGSQQDDGGLRLSHTEHTKVQTALGMWALAEWDDSLTTYRTLHRAASHMLARKSSNSTETWWTSDHCDKYWCDIAAMNALTVRGMSSMLHHFDALDGQPRTSYSLVDDADLGSTRVMQMVEGPDGWLWYLDANGAVFAKNLSTLETRTVATGLPFSYGLAVRSDGTAFVSSRGSVTRISPQGVKTTIFTAGSNALTDVVIGSNGLLYVSDYDGQRILRMSDSGGATTLASGGLLNRPYGLTWDGSGNLLIANSAGRNILKLAPNNAVTVFSAGVQYTPVWIERRAGGDYLVSAQASSGNPIGLYRLTADGYVQRLFNLATNSAGGVAPIGLFGGNTYIGGTSTNRMRRLVEQLLPTNVADSVRAELPKIARYQLNRHKDNNGNNLTHAWRLMSLAEIAQHQPDGGLKNELNTAIALIANLLRARQRTDGGWGFTTGHGSDSLVTSAVGIALDYTNPSVNDQAIRKAISFLLSKQQSDKSWPNENGIFGTKLASTSFVMAYLPLALERLGGIDINLNLVTPPNIALANPSVAPTATNPQGDGRVAYRWFFQGVTSQTRNLGFDLTLQNMTHQEERPGTEDAYLQFANSFNGTTVRSDLVIPKIRAVSDLALTVGTDQPRYGASSPVVLSSLVNNVGPAVSGGQVHLYVRTTGDGTVIADLGRYPYGALATNGAQTLTTVWNTGQFIAGTYELYGQLYDQAGRLASRDTALFDIVAANPSASLRTTTDKPVYHTTDRVQIGNLVRNLSTNASIPDAHLRVRVTSPSGSPAFSTLVRLGDMSGGAVADPPLTQALKGAAQGTYVVLGEVLDASGTLLASDDASYEVSESLALSIRGNVTAAVPAVHQGESQSCTDVVTNAGTRPVSELPVRQLLARLDEDELLQSSDTSMSLASGGDETLVRGFNTETMALGFYACALEARINGEWKPLANAVFEVLEPPIRISTTFQVGKKGRLLILLDPPANNGDQTDPLGPLPPGAPLLHQQRTWLEDVLTREGWSYSIVLDAPAFMREMRSGAYSVYALLSETVKLDEQFQREFREAIYRGEGLVEAGSHDQRNQVVDEALGVKFVGKHAQVSGVDLQVSELSTGGRADYPVADKTLRAILAGAQARGTVNVLGTNQPVLTSYAFGSGKSVYAGFDLLIHSTKTGDASLFTGLLKSAPLHVEPPFDALKANRVVPVTLTLTNEGIATLGRVVFSLPQGSIIEDAGLAEITGEHELVWIFDLPEGGMQALTFWIRLPAQEGSATVHASVQVLKSEAYVEHSSSDLSLTFTKPAGLVQALSETATDLGLKLVNKYLTDASAALEKNDYAGATKALVQAADELAKSAHARAPIIRKMVGQALYEVGMRL